MFTKTLISAFILATCSYGAEENCINEYYAPCANADDCCGPMSCWDADPGNHLCQVSCMWDFQC